MLKKLISTAILSSVIGSVSANPELGYMTLNTDQHHFFNATIAIDALPAELADKKLKVKLGSITDFYRHDIEYNKQVASLRFKVTRDSNGKPLIRVRSTREITEEQLQAVVKLYVGIQKIYGVYDFQLAPNKEERHVALNLLNSDHKPVEKQLSVAKEERQTLVSVETPETDFSGSKEQKTDEALPTETTTAFEAKPTEADESRSYRVSRGETISLIAIKLYPDYPELEHWTGLMGELITLNPDAFIDGDINLLRAETELRLPEQTQLISESVASNTVDQTLNQADESVSKLEEITEVSQNTIEEAFHFQNTASSPIESDSNIYQVENGESISAIAMKLMPDYPETDQWQAVMSRLVALNPEAFIDGDVNKLLANALLILPARDDFEVEAENQELPEETFVAINEQTSEITDEPTPQAEVISSTRGSDQYQVSRGESISAIAMKLAPDYPQADGWKGIMEQLVTLNPEAFIQSDANRLRADAFLTLPAKEHFEVEAENYEQQADADSPGEDLSQAGIYEVSKGESLSSISVQLLPEYPNAVSVEAVMDRLVELNLQAFVGGDANRLLAESTLNLPSEEDFNVDSISEEESENRYQVSVGENISTIALKLLPNYPQAEGWKVVMNRLILLNPKAFIDGDTDRLRSDALLTIPGQGDLEIEAENQELPDNLIPDLSFNKDHPADKKKVN